MKKSVVLALVMAALGTSGEALTFDTAATCDIGNGSYTASAIGGCSFPGASAGTSSAGVGRISVLQNGWRAFASASGEGFAGPGGFASSERVQVRVEAWLIEELTFAAGASPTSFTGSIQTSGTASFGASQVASTGFATEDARLVVFQPGAGLDGDLGNNMIGNRPNFAEVATSNGLKAGNAAGDPGFASGVDRATGTVDISGLVSPSNTLLVGLVVTLLADCPPTTATCTATFDGENTFLIGGFSFSDGDGQVVAFTSELGFDFSAPIVPLPASAFLLLAALGTAVMLQRRA